MDYIQRSYTTISEAISFLSRKFDNISIPIKSNYLYDLLVEKDFNILRVKIIMTDSQQPSGAYVANLRKSGGYSEKKEIKKPFDPKFCDLVYVKTPEGIYLIPSLEIQTTRSITLSQFENFRFIPS